MCSRKDDRNTAARIRDAAIECFAADGVDGTSIRTIAARAGVSPGSVIHHFGSKEQLREECDSYIAAYIREYKGEAMASGPGLDIPGLLRKQSDGPSMLRYLARTLVDGSPSVAALVDELAADAATYMQVGVETGMITPSRFPRERAAILTIWSLGAFVLHEHLERLVGVDITADFSKNPTAARSYVGPAIELAAGFITDTTREIMESALVDTSEQRESETA